MSTPEKPKLHLIDAHVERTTELQGGQTIIAPGITLTNAGGDSVTFSRFGNLFEVSNAKK